MLRLKISITFEVYKPAQEKWTPKNKLLFRGGNLLWKDFIRAKTENAKLGEKDYCDNAVILIVQSR